MNNIEIGLRVASETRTLARRAVEELSHSNPGYKIARARSVCPVDYMRYAEFDAILRDLEIRPRMRILDVSSPQWLSLYLANKYPNVEFTYINIIDSEIEPFKVIAKALGVRNLEYRKEDVRNMQLPDNTYDRVISISVIEHVYPENEGDLNALNEINRVVKHGGELLLTVPCKSKSNIVYKNGPVHERKEETKRNFYAREYDEEMFNTLVEMSMFSMAGSRLISERTGILPLDYYTWGPGKSLFYAKPLIKAKILLERIFRLSFDEYLAKRYLSVSQDVNGRLVNISARLIKTV
jgi:ubiquinone/menaquinone biosynthesis C-methylase UbiE